MVPDVVQLRVYGHRQGRRAPLLRGWKALEVHEEANGFPGGRGSGRKAAPGAGTGFSRPRRAGVLRCKPPDTQNTWLPLLFSAEPPKAWLQVVVTPLGRSRGCPAVVGDTVYLGLGYMQELGVPGADRGRGRRGSGWALELDRGVGVPAVLLHPDTVGCHRASVRLHFLTWDTRVTVAPASGAAARTQ